MCFKEWWSSNFGYGRELVRSGVDGAKSAGKASLEGQSVGSVLADSALQSWKHVAVGVAAGAVVGKLAGSRRPVRNAAIMGVCGGVLGFLAGMAWGTREVTGDIFHGVRRNVGAVRDSRWLEKNPIDYA
jgi:hypothetical protein